MYLDIKICDAFDLCEGKPLLQRKFRDFQLTVAEAVEGITPRVDKAP